MKSFSLACCAVVGVAETVADINFTSIGNISIEHPFQMHVDQWVDFYSTSDPFLLVTSFDTTPNAPGSVTIVPNLKEAIKK